MPSGINNNIKWSMLELRGLVEDEDARVYFQRAKRHLGLHPFHLNDLNRALREILSSKVNFYDKELQGLVLAYKNPKLLSPLGAILHDSHFIHVDIIADFYLFKPEIGCTLKGIINKKADNHVGVLVHKAFNVSIPKPEESKKWLGDSVYVGQEVKFTVTDLDFKGKLPFIRGNLLADGIVVATHADRVSSINGEEEDKKPRRWENPERAKLGSESAEKRSKKHRIVDSSGDELSDSDNKLRVLKKKARNTKKLELGTGSESAKTSSKKGKIVDSSGDELSDSDNKLKVFREKERSTKKLELGTGSEAAKKRSKKDRIVDSSDDELSESDNKLKVFREKEGNTKKLELGTGSEAAKKRSKKDRIVDSSGDELSESDNKLKVFREKKGNTKKRSKKDRIVDSSGDELSESDNKLKVFREKERNTKKRSKKDRIVDSSGDELSESDNKIKVFREKERTTEKLELGTGLEVAKKRSKKDRIVDSSVDELSDSDNKLKVFRGKETSAKVKKSASAVNRIDDELHTDGSEEQAPNNDSTEDPEGSSHKRHHKKHRDSSHKKLESEDIDEKPKISPRKASKRRHADEESDTTGDEPVLKTEKQSSSKKRSDKNTIQATSPEKEACPIERKTGIIESLKVEKSAKDKKGEFSSKSKISNNGVQHDDRDESVVSPKKRSKKSQIFDSESEETSDDTKPGIRVKKKKKTKIKTDEEEAVNSTVEKESKVLPTPDGHFEFVKPDVDACVLPSVKSKRKRRKNVDGNADEASDSSQPDPAEDNQAENVFFRDIRIKAEPDPSDVEDAVSRKKSVKKRKKHAKTEQESGDESLFADTRIKTEPDLTDLEDAMPSKKKSKRRKTSDKDSITDIKIKVEPNASDVEDSSIPKKKFKSEPHDSEHKVDRESNKV